VPNTLTQVDIYNSSVTGINDVVYTAGWINDTWKLNSRLTLNLGVRIENYKDQWPDQSLVPNGQPALAGWTDPRWVSFIARRTSRRPPLPTPPRWRRRSGLPTTLSGDNRTVLKGLRRSVALELGGHAGRPGKPRRSGGAALRVRVVLGYG
jgi:hypothetical protein